MPQSDEFFKSILDNINNGVYFVDRERRITYWNKGAEEISGLSPEAVQGRFCGDGLLKHVDEEGKILCHDGCPLAQVMEDGETREVQIYLQHTDGHRVPVSVRAMPIRDEGGEITGAVETFTDNSALMQARYAIREFRKKSIQDPLTGLGNRRYIEVKLHAVLAEYQHFGTLSGVLYLDVDHFKSINDTYGHLIGDKVLNTVSQTLLHNIREYDFIGRWGGDELVCILTDVDEAQLIRIGEKLRMLVSRSSVDVDGLNLSPTISIGATLIKDGDTAESILERADRLLYQCKEQGRNRLNFEA